jgi:hypothetical protein
VVEHLALASDALTPSRQATLLLCTEIALGFAAGPAAGGSGALLGVAGAARSPLEKDCVDLHAAVIRANALANVPRWG